MNKRFNSLNMFNVTINYNISTNLNSIIENSNELLKENESKTKEIYIYISFRYIQFSFY